MLVGERVRQGDEEVGIVLEAERAGVKEDELVFQVMQAGEAVVLGPKRNVRQRAPVGDHRHRRRPAQRLGQVAAEILADQDHRVAVHQLPPLHLPVVPGDQPSGPQPTSRQQPLDRHAIEVLDPVDEGGAAVLAGGDDQVLRVERRVSGDDDVRRDLTDVFGRGRPIELVVPPAADEVGLRVGPVDADRQDCQPLGIAPVAFRAAFRPRIPGEVQMVDRVPAAREVPGQIELEWVSSVVVDDDPHSITPKGDEARPEISAADTNSEPYATSSGALAPRKDDPEPRPRGATVLDHAALG